MHSHTEEERLESTVDTVKLSQRLKEIQKAEILLTTLRSKLGNFLTEKIFDNHSDIRIEYICYRMINSSLSSSLSRLLIPWWCNLDPYNEEDGGPNILVSNPAYNHKQMKHARTISNISLASSTDIFPTELENSKYHITSDISNQDFNILKVLGKGSFGKVMLVKKVDTEEHYAMKTLRKATLIKRKQLAHTATERYVLENVKSPFLVSLKYAFQTAHKLYMVMDYMGGGELYFWLKKDRTFSETRTKLYIAEVVLGIDALHSVDVIYRDLKAENILLDMDGHIKLTDFGLAKAGVTGYGANGGTRTFCGSNEYLAPEIILKKGHGKAVDWWSLGILTYELLFGLPPFYDKYVKDMHSKITRASIHFPVHIDVSLKSKDFISRLLSKNVSNRLGSLGTQDITNAAWMKEVDFEHVLNKLYTPEFIPPQRQSEMSIDNFDVLFTEQPAIDSPVGAILSDYSEHESDFHNFSFSFVD